MTVRPGASSPVVEQASGPIAILAGSGDLPRLVAEQLERSGREHRILAFRGFADRKLAADAHATLDLLDVRGAVACLDRWQPCAVTLAGGIRRPAASAVLGAFSVVRNREEIGRLLARGDDNLLRGVVDILEERGHQLVGILDIAPELLAPTGTLGAHAPDARGLAAIETGLRLLDDLSAYDIGQAAIVDGHRILAIEGPEGTDAAIARSGRVHRRWRWRRTPSSGAVLVKAPKRGQDLRVDLPAVGPRTVVKAARAGLSGIAVASGLTLVIDQAETVRQADRLGLFLVGIGRPT